LIEKGRSNRRERNVPATIVWIQGRTVETLTSSSIHKPFEVKTSIRGTGRTLIIVAVPPKASKRRIYSFNISDVLDTVVIDICDRGQTSRRPSGKPENREVTVLERRWRCSCVKDFRL
jgi:hypothetical protein